MKKQAAISILLSVFISFSMCYAQSAKPVTDYLAIPGPVVFQHQPYQLSWSSHPSATYYKQEYLVQGDTADRYKTMILMEVVSGDVNPKEFVAAKMEELSRLKKTNPVVQYESFNNAKTGEYLLDFLLSAATPEGKLTVVERNLYRYKTFRNKKGQTGLLLFGLSTRSYGAAIPGFLSGLKNTRNILVTEVGQYPVPEPVVK